MASHVNANGSFDNRIHLVRTLSHGACQGIIKMAAYVSRLRCIWERSNVAELILQLLTSRGYNAVGLEASLKSDFELLMAFLTQGYSTARSKWPPRRFEWLVEQLHGMVAT
jgi:hypothetical protein